MENSSKEQNVDLKAVFETCANIERTMKTKNLPSSPNPKQKMFDKNKQITYFARWVRTSQRDDENDEQTAGVNNQSIHDKIISDWDDSAFEAFACVQDPASLSHVAEIDSEFLSKVNINSVDDNVHKNMVTLKFIGESTFPDEFKDYRLVEQKIKEFKPDAKIAIAFIDSENTLVIKTDKPNQLEYLRTWPDEVFGMQIVLIENKTKYLLTLHGIDHCLSVKSEALINYMKYKFDIQDLHRLILDSSGQELDIVRATTYNKGMFEKILDEGFIMVGHKIVLASVSEFDLNEDSYNGVQKSLFN